LHYEIHILQEKLTCFRVRAHEANASGNRPENHIRCAFEFIRILRNFLNIPNRSDLLTIFPEAIHLVDAIPSLDSDDIAFVLTQLAVQGDLIHQAFALDVLFEKLGNPSCAKKIHERYQFGYKELIHLTGALDLMQLTRQPPPPEP